MSIKRHIMNVLPDSVLRGIKRRYYPRVVRNYSEADWAFSPIVKALIPEGGMVLDVGANIGYLSKLFSNWVGASGCVHSFEPIPETFALLQNNLHRVGLRNVCPHNLALSNVSGSSTMLIPEYPDGRPNFYESHITDDGAGVTIQTETLDHLEMGPVAFIKIDVEGHEWNVIQGGQALISRDLPPLLIEVAGNLAAVESPAGVLNAFLTNLGYRPFLLQEERLVAWQEPFRAVDYLFLTEKQRVLLGVEA
ncbi:MAG: FkbM family methyltransferase [Candidatus Omnitrophota bacterium]|jgi:FkbM family methyltransferase